MGRNKKDDSTDNNRNDVNNTVREPEEVIPEWKSSFKPEEAIQEKASFGQKLHTALLKYKYILAAVAVIVLLGLAGGRIIAGLLSTDTVKEHKEILEQASEETKTEPSEEMEETADAENTADTETVEEETEDAEQSAEETVESEETETIQTPVSGIVHVESYEALYEMLGEYQSASETSASDGARVYTETGETMAAYQVDEVTTDSVAVEDTVEEVDPGYTYEEESDSDHSETNTQEEAIAEADIVKTDGTYIYAMDSLGDIRIVDAASMKKVSEILADRNASYQEMYLDGDTLQVVSQQEIYRTYADTVDLPSAGKTAVRTSYSVPETTTVVETYDISVCEEPKKTGAVHLDGCYLTSRRNDEYLYIFTSYTPETGDSADEKEKYVPVIGSDYVPYDHIYLPSDTEDYAYDGKDYLVAASIADSRSDQIIDCMAVVSGGDTFYVSENNIYTAVLKWDSKETSTEILRIGYEDGYFTDGATGSVPGELNNSFSMNEYDQNLRVVSTTEKWSKNNNEFLRSNGLYILDRSMQIIGKTEDLAENEEIKSARFMGDIGYFVTYRNTDPLFAADLSDPTDPKIIGELEVTGFSEYLHFYGEDRLLGIGWETDPDTGITEGLKCSMFDISDPSDVKEIDRIVLKDVDECAALSNYRSILISQDKNLFGFAYGLYKNTGKGNYYHTEELFYYGLLSYDEDEGFAPGAYLNVEQSGLFDEDLTYSEYLSLRGVYIGDVFYLVTDEGICSYDMTDGYTLKDTLKWKS